MSTTTNRPPTVMMGRGPDGTYERALTDREVLIARKDRFRSGPTGRSRMVKRWRLYLHVTTGPLAPASGTRAVEVLVGSPDGYATLRDVRELIAAHEHDRAIDGARIRWASAREVAATLAFATRRPYADVVAYVTANLEESTGASLEPGFGLPPESVLDTSGGDAHTRRVMASTDHLLGTHTPPAPAALEHLARALDDAALAERLRIGDRDSRRFTRAERSAFALEAARRLEEHGERETALADGAHLVVGWESSDGTTVDGRRTRHMVTADAARLRALTMLEEGCHVAEVAAGPTRYYAEEDGAVRVEHPDGREERLTPGGAA